MEWVYLSPHFDDVSFSCGGLVWEQAQTGMQVSVWTICAGDPLPGPLPPFAEKLHARWDIGQAAVQQRRAEDKASCQVLGAVAQHFNIPDCIYRRSAVDGLPYYPDEGDIFGELHPDEASLVDELATTLSGELPPQAHLVCPLGIGNHVDHYLVKLAAERLDHPTWYYADYPYVLKGGESEIKKYAELSPVLLGVSDEGLDAWERAVTAYSSQISSFWKNLESARKSIREYHQQFNGIRLWRKLH
jgi:LmbE family N-acetylglucosaminyl deacetylase